MPARRTPFRALFQGAVVLTLALFASVLGPVRPASAAVAVPGEDGTVFGIAVYDRQSGWVYSERGRVQFRSASVIKIVIATDFLKSHATVSSSDGTRLARMLQASNDDDATYFWNMGGRANIISRMKTEMGLLDIAPPSDLSIWGYSLISAEDVVRMYIYLLDRNPTLGQKVMTHLRQWQQCASDGFDQSFGIPSAFRSAVAVKQGWSGFGERFSGCPLPPAVVASNNPLPVALHTTGTVGSGDRSIVAVLSLQPRGTASEEAAERLTRVTQALNVPGASYAPPLAATPGTWFPTWDTGVRVRPGPGTSGTPLTTLPSGKEVYIGCQQKGDTVTIGGVVNDWWAYLPEYGGFMTNYYVDTPQNTEPGVPVCGVGGYPFMTWGTDVVLHTEARLASPRTTVLGGPTEVIVECQKLGDTVNAEGVTNSWWAKLRGLGFVTNIYIDYTYNKLPNVPLC